MPLSNAKDFCFTVTFILIALFGFFIACIALEVIVGIIGLLIFCLWPCFCILCLSLIRSEEKKKQQRDQARNGHGSQWQTR